MTDELAGDALIPAGLAAAAFNAVAAPVAVLDADGTILQVNPACARLCACEPDRLRRRSWQSLAGAEQTETLRQVLASPGSVGAPVSRETRWGLPGAERRTVVWSYCAVTDGPGERLCVIATGSDVTEARATEQALRESDACFRRLTENIREVFFIRDVRHNRKLYVSPAYEQIWGRPVQALYDDPEEFLRSVHPEDRGRVEAAMQTQTPDRLLDEEYRIVRPDGAQRWIRARAFPVLDEEGELSCVAGIAEDITHRRQAEDAVKDSEAQLRQIIDLVPHMIFVKDWEGRFLLVNEAKAQVFGTTVEALTGRTQAQLGGDPVQLRQMLADDREVMASGRLKFVPEEIFTDVAGHQRVLETLKMPYVVAGQAARAVLGVATDITDRKRMERALVAEEEKYRSVVEALAEGVALIGADELIYACNPSVARILDVPMEALIGCRWYQVDWRRRGEDGASLNRDRHPIAVALRTGQRFSEVVMRLERPSRRVTWVSINIRPLLRDRDPQPSAVVVSLHDITAQKEMEAALRASEAKYRALMEGASDGILVTDSEGRLLDSNRRVQDLLGYAPEELKGLAAADIYPGGELREVLSMFSRILSSGPAMRQSWLLRKDGVCVPVEMAANTIEYHGVRVVQSIFRDLRERREAELQTAKLSGAVEQTADAVMITDRHGTIEYVNPAFQAITGYTAEDVVGNTPGLLRSGRMDRQFYARFWSTILSGSTFRATFVNRRKNGSLYHEDKTVTPIRDPLGQVSHFVSSSRDVTEKVAAERMRREEEKAHRDALVREVHHRIKNHLQGLVGLLRQEITRSAEHGAPLEKVIGQIHSMSVVHGLQSASGHGEIRLCEMLTAICRSAEQVMGLTVELDLALEMERPLRVAPDEAVSVALVFNELLVNAAKYGSTGEPVRVRLRGAAAKGEVKIINMAPRLPETFDFAAGRGLGTGLALVRVLLPRRGAALDIRWNDGFVEACLGLDAPVLVPP